MKALRCFTANVFAPAPAERLAALRVLVGGFASVYLLSRAVHLTRFSEFSPNQFKPVGLIALLTKPLPASWVIAVYAVACVSSIVFTLGYWHRSNGLLFAFSLLWVLSYRNSWGMIFHTENLLVLHALILALAPAADAWVLRPRRDSAVPDPHGRYGWPIHALRLVVALSYFVAGIAKLRAAGFDWILGDELRSHIAFDAVRKLELGSLHSTLGAALVPHAWIFPPLAVLTLAFELGAPLALLGGRVTKVWCAVAWGFHVGVLALMLIVFPYALLGFAFAPFFEIEKPFQRWVWPRLARLRKRNTLEKTLV